MMKPVSTLRSTRVRILSAVLLASAAVSASQVALSQSRNRAGEERWYQVELIIFAQGASRENEEVWRPDIRLDYPMQWQELVDASQLLTPDEDMVRDALTTDGEAPADADVSDSPLGASPSRPAIGDEVGGIDRLLREQAVAENPVNQLSDRAILLLPETELTLGDQVRRLRRAQNYRILFHGGWRQSFVENRPEPSVLIAGGDLFDEHHELEGSLNLNLRTYLHVETDLWLAQFAPNFGQEREPWPALPVPPNRPVDPLRLLRIDDAGTGLWHQLNQDQDQEQGREFESILAQPYVVENVVLMQQQRRMRSGELHYIDHPRMGLLIKLTPYEPEDEEGQDEPNERR